jgi:hypothetical protein
MVDYSAAVDRSPFTGSGQKQRAGAAQQIEATPKQRGLLNDGLQVASDEASAGGEREKTPQHERRVVRDNALSLFFGESWRGVDGSGLSA